MPEKEVPKILAHQTKNNLSIEEALISSNIATEDDIAKAYSEYFQVALLPPEELAKQIAGAYDLAKLLPERFSRANKVVPLKKDGDSLQIVLINPGEIFVIQEIYLYTGLKV
ncbi:MAG TPA: hypothetical protein PLL10_10650, partial [Elusimicrobiales bacterium]|nr:hypothetical protein [Elusimicrobiales bacterium]